MTYDICIAVGPYNKLGGIERYNVELVGALQKAGHRISIVATRVGSDTSNIQKVIHLRTNLFFQPLNFLMNAIKTSFVYFHFKNKYPRGLFIVDGLPSFFADIVIAQSVHRQSVADSNAREPGNLKGALRRCARILYPMNLVIIFLEWFMEKFGAKQIIAISAKVKREILRVYAVNEKKIVIVYSAVNAKEFSPNSDMRNRLRQEYGFRNDDFIFLFSGHEFKRKGLKYAIEALAKIDDKKAKLVVAGKDNPTHYKELAKKLHVGERIFFIGPRSDFSDWCVISDAFIFPTLEDAFGLVIVEAMASGLPVITSGPIFAGAAECMENGTDGLLLDDPTDTGKMAFYMNSLMTNEKLRISLGAHAQKTAEGLSWERVASEIIGSWEIYLETKHHP